MQSESLRRRRRMRLGILAAMVIGLVAVASASGGAAIHRPTGHHAGSIRREPLSIPSTFTSPVHISTTFEGCRNTGGITLPNGSGDFVCPDAAYTTGNLGKGWNELDLVPFRLTTTAGTQSTVTTEYNVIVAGDYQLNGATGWDVIGGDGTGSTPTTASGSDMSCHVSWNTQDTGPGITGGADSSIYRVMTIQQDPGTTCTFDYYMRIALGAHLYSGSSLQAYIFTESNFIGGKSTIPLPVNEILAQSISKDMAASTSADQPWDVTKTPTPATLGFGDVCSSGFSNTKTVQIQVAWTKLAPTPSGQVRLITHVYATNPAAREVTVNVTDVQYAGTTQATQVGTASTPTGGIDVPANTANFLVLTDDNTITSSETHFNDVATATYTDKVTGVPVPGSTTATAAADVEVGSTTNGSATVTDSESITDTQNALTFAVAAPSSGSFTGGYTAGTYTTGPVGWTSGTNAITSSGSITFDKTVKLSSAVATSGTLSDTANLTGSDGFTATPALASVDISSSSTSTLTITKNIPNVLQTGESATFQFHVYSGNVDVADPSVTFNAGDTQKTVQVGGLAQGSYTVTEDTAAGWLPQDSQTVDITGCSAGVTFNNDFAPATAFANKVTDPTGFASGWTFTLTRPDGSTLTGTTDAAGHVVWTGGSSTSAPLGDEGAYTIAESPQTGWTEVGAADAGGTGAVTGGTGAGASCSFTVDYPVDSGKTFGCTITNKSRGHVQVVKTFEGSALTGSEAFTFQIRDGASAIAAGTIVESGVADVSDNGTIAFASDLLPGHTYALCEVLQANINSSLSGLTSYNPNGDTGVVCVDFSFTPASTVNDPAVTFNVDNTPVPAQAQVRKVTDPAGYESGWQMTLTGPGTPVGGEKATTTGTGYVGFTTPLQDGGSYTITESSQTGWTQVSASSDCSFTVQYPADAGRTFSCTITNRSRGTVRVVKTLNGGSLGSRSFTFELRQGSQKATSTSALETLVADSANSGVLDFGYALVPGQTYAICELLVDGYGPDISGYGPYNPADDPNYWCFDFSITVAQAANTPSVVFDVDNSHAFTKALTIGYWKNWSSCKKSKGKQTDSLGPALGSGIALGPYTVTSECAAVDLLSKSNVKGVKEPGDPIYNMVAQELAAKLNLNIDAGSCPALTAALTSADDLLTQIGFDGVASYTSSLTQAQATLANQLAATLDAYNNNQLC